MVDHGEIEDCLNGIWFEVEIVGRCLKFLLEYISFFVKWILYRIFLNFLCDCN